MCIIATDFFLLFHFRFIFLRHISFYLNSIFFFFRVCVCVCVYFSIQSKPLLHIEFSLFCIFHAYSILPYITFWVCLLLRQYFYVYKSIISFNSRDEENVFMCVCVCVRFAVIAQICFVSCSFYTTQIL